MAQGTTEYIDLTTVDVFLTEVWSSMVSAARQSKLVFASNVDRSPERELKPGQIYRRQRVSHLTPTVKSANSAISYETTTESEDTLTINNYYYAAFAVEDVITPMVKVNQIEAYMPEIGYALALQEDDTLAALIDDGTITQTVGTLATGLTYDNYVRADQYLNDGNVPDSDRCIIISNAEKANALKQEQFINSQYVKLTEGRSNTGLLGGILGYPVFVTNNVDGSNAAGHDNVMMHKSTIMFAQQISPNVHTGWDQDYYCAKVSGLETFGADFNKAYASTHSVWMKGL
jgi:hypothetical protein